MTPQPWPRIGPGTATDGKPKFDLSKFDPAYFDRLREHVIAAGNRGIYVAVMLFDGWGLHLSPAPDNVEGHPFYAANNVNRIGITSIIDYQVLPLDPRVQALQEAFSRLRGSHAPRRAVEQAHAEPRLEIAQPLAQARDGNPLGARRAAEIAVPRHGREGGKVAQVELGHRSPIRTVHVKLYGLSADARPAISRRHPFFFRSRR